MRSSWYVVDMIYRVRSVNLYYQGNSDILQTEIYQISVDNEIFLFYRTHRLYFIAFNLTVAPISNVEVLSDESICFRVFEDRVLIEILDAISVKLSFP
jgi:hypothetical protein